MPFFCFPFGLTVFIHVFGLLRGKSQEKAKEIVFLVYYMQSGSGSIELVKQTNFHDDFIFAPRKINLTLERSPVYI